MTKRNFLIGTMMMVCIFFMLYETGCGPGTSKDEETKMEENAQVDFSGYPDFGVMISAADFADS